MKSIQYSISSLLIIGSFMPFLAFAEDTTTSATTPTTTVSIPVPPENKFCSKFTEISTKLANQISDNEAKKKENESKNALIIAEKEAKVDAKKAAARTDADDKRIKNFDKANVKAKTDSQKAAVEVYKQSMTVAVTARRTAVDAAVKTYRDGITALLASKNTTTDTSMATFKTAVDAATIKATADCANKVSNKTISSTFNKAIKDARATLAANKKSGTQATAMKTLKDARDIAFKQAESDFKNATDKARTTLLMSMK